eukprot:maker-scaffold_4-snap-gene-2.40-mRNA-1 protein AED:0.00 eAED:0.00 QI:33/1/1/1/1/1/4/35/419
MKSVLGQKPPYLPTSKHNVNKTDFYANVGKALDTGLEMAGVTKTKTGAGDKEKAYLVKKYTMMLSLLFLAVVVFTFMMISFFSYLDITYVKRSVLHRLSAQELEAETAELKLMKVSLGLQTALEHEIHDFSSYLNFMHIPSSEFKVLTKEASEILNTISGLSEEKKNEVLKAIENSFMRMKRDMLTKQKKHTRRVADSKKALTKLKEDIELDVDELEREKEEFVRKTIDLGLQKDQKFDYKKDVLDYYGDDEEILTMLKEESELEEDFETRIERFYAKLELITFPEVNQDEVRKWMSMVEEQYEKLAQVYSQIDEGEEEIIDEEFLKSVPKIIKKYCTEGEQLAFSKLTNTEEVLEFFEPIVLRAKLSAHKQELLDIYLAWKAGGVNAMTVFSNIEKFAEQEKVFRLYDVLYNADESFI